MTLALDRSTEAVGTAVPAVAGAALRVPLVTGGDIGYANLDHAASAPCLDAVRSAVDEFLPWYASVHRGAGFASQVSTRLYERTRDVVRRFVDARSGDSVIFTRNTTDAFNLLAKALPRKTSVVVFDSEHHAALLPWRGPNVRRVQLPRTRLAAVSVVDEALAECPQGPRLVVVAGASNVTGELLPVAEIAAVARNHGARVALDAAQLAPHRRISLRELDVDYVALSGHKLYAPFGAGALIGRGDWLRAAEPYLAGGGATKLVTEEAVVWNSGEERHEAGSPNTVGVYALGVACEQLAAQWDAVGSHEAALLERLRKGLEGLPGFAELRFFDAPVDRVGTVSFVVDGFEPGWLAAVLSAEYGIGVRDGAFCAHVAARRLIREAGSEGQQAVRVSLGLGSTEEHVDRLVLALRQIVARGARWEYAKADGRWAPVGDTRELPPFCA
ncbi:aminotransferase class V-fold PLP-dependent enzyme [Amycolatopsis rubida]|uniref:Aminotransferase class V-fold PLP-dependent enzyme n=1 Tax=Amycolatopsis rubida TaxID=112413 RepID=A0A1I5L525_9PSEU|nr:MULTISPECIES: aminotransferase class V-fold PLP-dependent enzyme [Amycolatopsis]MYW94840.1 aminotransferase class V-fold PLP-dependent enzyme [Amycolatopsis rubida]NEC59827.1 aminotransferase class V-fold PLP-dependent enzyme [Amycolatopsis rubida]OAP25235.1 putative cysteine desulfurase [Amycolatopsis sp. M39]SFO92293.1 Selenocysteine lyase/Cysteine desulfurase [Amycolatopsis rubida]